MNIDDGAIADVESFVRNQLVERILATTVVEKDLINYFGKFYASKPQEFHFQIGEKVLIKRIATHIKKIHDQKGLHCFEEKLPSAETESKNKILNESPTHVFLQKLLDQADRNYSRNKHGHRFDDDIKQFASYVRMIGGPLTYETIQKNMPAALPALQSTNRYIQKTHSHITEAILRCDELLVFLKERNLPLIVSLSEDATRIVDRIQYDRSTNQIVGFTLPLRNGMPVPLSYPARNFKEILKHFTNKNPSSTLMNVVMAQPLADVPPFCLLLFGTENKYNAADVAMRWETIVDRLRELGITVLTIASDSDPRYNSAMRKNSKLGNESTIFLHEWFSCGHVDDYHPIYFQDMIHIGMKLRNFILRTLWKHKTLPFGDYFIDIDHLYTIMDMFPKDLHQLTKTVLNPKDKQNFSSVLKICDERVVDLLIKNVEGSEGTAKFLEVLRKILDSMLKLSLKPLECIERIWYAVFLFRIWRQFIIDSTEFTLKDNFLTNNCFSCIELNAHSLVKVLLRLKNLNAPELFKTNLFASQPCESLFRQTRSFTTTYSTVVNFSVKEMLERINRIHLQYDIANQYSGMFVFPRLSMQRSSEVNFELPSETEISNRIEASKKNAIKHATELGLIHNKRKKALKLKCPIKPMIWNDKPSNDEPVALKNNVINPIKFKNINLKNYSDKCLNKPVDELSQYVEVPNTNGKRIVLKKTSLCWLLRDDFMQLSSNRIERVKQSVTKKTRKKPTSFPQKCLMFRFRYKNGTSSRKLFSKKKW